MSQQAAVVTARHQQMLNYMSLIQSHLRDDPAFQTLQSESSIDRLSGQPWGPNSVCDSRWTLRGAHGAIEVRASVNYSQGAILLTEIACSSTRLASGRTERSFGGDNQPSCTLANVMPVLTELLQVVTAEGSDPFAGVAVPKAPHA